MLDISNTIQVIFNIRKILKAEINDDKSSCAMAFSTKVWGED
jgi:hypothetical protein